MKLPDKCPFCGAAIAVGDDGEKRVADLCVIFDCGSGLHELMDPIRTRSRACEEITRLAARVTELEARCKQMEDAAREVYLDSIASDHQWSTNETRNMRALRDACPHCLRVECECSDFDVCPDMGDKS